MTSLSGTSSVGSNISDLSQTSVIPPTNMLEPGNTGADSLQVLPSEQPLIHNSSKNNTAVANHWDIHTAIDDNICYHSLPDNNQT